MSTDTPVELNSINSREELERAYRDLVNSISDLEAELNEERDHRKHIEKQLGELEDALTRQYQNLLDDIVAVESRMDDAFEDAVQSVDPDRALPIMQITRTYKTEPRSLTDTQRRAAIVWSKFFDVCNRTTTVYSVFSDDVGKVLAAHDEDVHRETRNRVMKLVAELGRQHITLETIKGRNALVIDRGSFDEYAASVTESGGFDE